MPELVQAVLSRCDPRLLPMQMPLDDLEWVAVRGRGRGSKCNVVVLSRGRALLFLKSSLADGREDLQREHDALVALQRHPELRGAVPASLGLHDVVGRHVLVQTALPGTPVSLALRTTLRRRASVTTSLHATQRWLSALQRTTTSGRTPVDVAGLLERYRGAVAHGRALSATGSRTLERLEQSASRLQGLTIPETGGHGDLWPGNLLLARGQVGVVDWEHYEEATNPLRDLVFLLLTTAYSFPWQGRRWIAPALAFERAFLSSGWYGDLVLDVTRKHLRDLDVPASAGELLLFLTAADYVLRESDAGAPVGPPGADWDALSRSLLESGGSRLREL